MSVVSVVCCQVEISATSWSLVHRIPTECGVSKWVWSWSLEKWGGLGPQGAVEQLGGGEDKIVPSHAMRAFRPTGSRGSPPSFRSTPRELYHCKRVLDTHWIGSLVGLGADKNCLENRKIYLLCIKHIIVDIYNSTLLFFTFRIPHDISSSWPKHMGPFIHPITSHASLSSVFSWWKQIRDEDPRHVIPFLKISRRFYAA
jgi:hypothetical protein